MKKNIIILSVLCIPSVSQAAWWNPSTWNSAPAICAPMTQIQYVDRIVYATGTPQIITKTIAIADPGDALTIRNLEQQISNLKNSSVTRGFMTTQDDDVKMIKTELLNLSTLTDDLVKVASSTNISERKISDMLDILNGAKKLDGSRLFDSDAFLPNVVTFDQYGKLYYLPKSEWISKIISDYQNEMNLRLKQAQIMQ